MRDSNVGIIVILTLGLLCAPLIAADAQQSTQMPRVGVLRLGSQTDNLQLQFLGELRHGLRELGYIEGQNLALEIRWAEGQMERLPALVAELVRLPVDVIVVHGPAGVRAAQAATRTIPIVMARMDDADDHGFVASLARPGGNVTGLSFQTGELSGKWLTLLKEALPRLARVAVLWDGTGTANQLSTLESAARAIDVQLYVLEVRSPDEFDRAFAAAATAQADGLVILAAPLLTRYVPRLAELATTHRLPAVYYERSFAEAGGLLAYGPKASDPSWGWRRAAVYVDKILKGTNPADLPVERPTRFELIINLKATKALGITMPPSLLLLADEVIQ